MFLDLACFLDFMDFSLELICRTAGRCPTNCVSQHGGTFILYRKNDKILGKSLLQWEIILRRGLVICKKVRISFELVDSN